MDTSVGIIFFISPAPLIKLIKAKKLSICVLNLNSINNDYKSLLIHLNKLLRATSSREKRCERIAHVGISCGIQGGTVVCLEEELAQWTCFRGLTCRYCWGRNRTTPTVVFPTAGSVCQGFRICAIFKRKSTSSSPWSRSQRNSFHEGIVAATASSWWRAC